MRTKEKHSLIRLIEQIAYEAQIPKLAAEIADQLARVSEQDWEKHIIAVQRRYTNRERNRVYKANKRARDLGLPATLTLEEWEMTLAYFNWRCAYCCLPFSYEHIEHFVPLSDGDNMAGTTKTNCVPACQDCNTKKGSKTATYWVRLLNRHLPGLEDPFTYQVVKVGRYLLNMGESTHLEHLVTSQNLFDSCNMQEEQ